MVFGYFSHPNLGWRCPGPYYLIFYLIIPLHSVSPVLLLRSYKIWIIFFFFKFPYVAFKFSTRYDRQSRKELGFGINCWRDRVIVIIYLFIRELSQLVVNWLNFQVQLRNARVLKQRHQKLKMYTSIIQRFYRKRWYYLLKMKWCRPDWMIPRDCSWDSMINTTET